MYTSTPQYRLWIRRIPRTCAARGRRCLDKERPESDKDSTHTIGKRTVLQQVRVFGGTGEPYIRQLLVKCVGQRAHSTRLFDRQKQPTNRPGSARPPLESTEGKGPKLADAVHSNETRVGPSCSSWTHGRRSYPSTNRNPKLVSRVMGDHLTRFGEHLIMPLGRTRCGTDKKQARLICRGKGPVK
jgi:hypothetical protein